VQKIRVAFAAEWHEGGLASAEAALELAPESSELLLAAGLFASGARQPQRAIAHLALLLEMDTKAGSDNAQARYTLGSALDDVNQVYAGIAHLEICKRLAPESADVANTLAFVQRRASVLPEPAQWITCDECAARVALEPGLDVLCARCGSSLATKERHCPHCGHDGRVFPGLAVAGVSCLCPFCRTGSLSVG